jgi:hypothetical protein
VSNFLAPAVVTETLRHMLSDAAARAVPGTEVTLGRPQAPTNGSGGPAVNLYPYQVSPNAAWANADLPTRGSSGALTRRPQIGLSIDYLISFRGPELDLVPERLMGSCVSRLHAQPVLTRTVIEQAVADVLSTDPTHVLRDADLAEQVERVKLTALPLNLEELSKLWSVFFQVPYVLSVAYQASVVLIEEEIEAPAPPLPVRERRIVVQPFRRIRIVRVESSAGSDEPIHADSVIRIVGTGLGGGHVAVIIAGNAVAPAQMTARELTVDLAVLSNPRAGIFPLYVVHRVSEDAPQLRFESNVVALTVSPRILSVGFTPAIADDPTTDVDESAPATVNLEVTPVVGARQRVRLFLNELIDLGSPPGAEPLAYVIDAAPADEDAAARAVPVPDVEPGTYLVRVQVDGAESPLVLDDDPDSETFGRYIGHTVVVT